MKMRVKLRTTNMSGWSSACREVPGPLRSCTQRECAFLLGLSSPAGPLRQVGPRLRQGAAPPGQLVVGGGGLSNSQQMGRAESGQTHRRL